MNILFGCKNYVLGDHLFGFCASSGPLPTSPRADDSIAVEVTEYLRLITTDAEMW